MNAKEILGNSRSNGLLEFFNTMVEKEALNKQDLLDYKSGKKVFYTADLYVRKFLGTTLTGNIEVITENEVEYVTRCNLSKGRIPAEMNLIASHIDIKYGEALTATGYSLTPERIDYTNVMYDIADLEADAGRSVIASTTVLVRRIPISFCNGEYEVRSNDGIVDKGRISELLHRNTVSYATQGNGENKKMLFWPKLLKSDSTLRVTYKFPAAATGVPASTDFFTEFSVKGIYLGKRPEA